MGSLGHTVDLLSPGRCRVAHKGLRLGLVEVLLGPHSWSSSEVSGLLGGPSYLAVELISVLREFRALTTIGVSSRKWFALDLLLNISIFVDHVQLWLRNVIIKVDRLINRQLLLT